MAFLFYIPKWMEVCIVRKKECVQNGNNAEECWMTDTVAVTELRVNNDYVVWYLNFANLILKIIIPLASFIYLNVNIYLKFKQYLENKSSVNSMTITNKNEFIRNINQQTIMLFSIVILFVLAHVSRIATNIEEMISLPESKRVLEEQCEWLPHWTMKNSNQLYIILKSKLDVLE